MQENRFIWIRKTGETTGTKRSKLANRHELEGCKQRQWQESETLLKT